MGTHPDPEYRHALSDDEVRALGYSHRDERGRWIGRDLLSPSERSTRELRSQLASRALHNPTCCLNPDAMRDALADAFAGRPMIGALRRGLIEVPEVEPFDWQAMRRRVDEEHASDIQRVLNHGSKEGREGRPTFSVVTADARKGRTRAYGIAALENEAHAVASAPVGLRNETLNRSAWSLARLVRDGLIDAIDVEHVLVAAAIDAGLPEREARACVRGAMRRRGAGE